MRILRKWHSIKPYTRNGPGPKSAPGPVRSPSNGVESRARILIQNPTCIISIQSSAQGYFYHRWCLVNPSNTKIDIGPRGSGQSWSWIISEWLVCRFVSRLRLYLLFFEHLASPMPSKTIKNESLLKFCVDIGPQGSAGAPDGSECWFRARSIFGIRFCTH